MKHSYRSILLILFFLILMVHSAVADDRALNLKQSACYFSFGSGIGASDINVSPLSGFPEIVVGGGGLGFGDDQYWFILRHDPDHGTYNQVFVSPVVEEDDWIARIVTGDFVLGEDPEIVIATGNGVVEFWDQRARRKLGQFQVPTSELGGLALADADLDGTMDVIVTSTSYTGDTHLYVYTVNGTLQWELPDAGGTDVVVAQMDSDAQLEIAASGGAVVDSVSRSVQWTFPELLCVELEAADIDHDNMAELVSANYQDLDIFDVDTEELKGSIDSVRPEAIDLFDIDEDGAIEILVAGDQWSEEYCYDAETLELEWVVNNPDHGTTDIRCGDVDQDGVIELIWGAGHTSTGSDHIYVADWTTGTIEWSNEDLRGPYHGPLKGDVDGDGIPEIVTVTRESDKTSEDGRILVFNAADLSLRAMSGPVTDFGQSTYDFCLRDVDGDSTLEIVVATTEHYDGMIKIFKFFGIGLFNEIWALSDPLPDGHMTAVEVADLDLDGEMEVLGGAHNSVYVYDYLTGVQEWVSPYVDSGIRELQVADTDGDGVPEILALGYGTGDVHVFDGVTKALEAVIPAAGNVLRSVSLGGPQLIMVGDDTGTLTAYRYDGSQYPVFRSRSLSTEPIDGFTVGPNNLLWISSGGRLNLYNGYGNTLLWTSERYGLTFGYNVELVYPGPTVVTAGTFGIMGFTR